MKDIGAKLMWTEALRAALCMVPMVVAMIIGKTEYLVVLGQGGFFFSSLFLPKKTGARFVMGSLVVALGLGFYLIGGTVAPSPWVASLFTFLICLNLSYMTSWNVGGALALTYVMIYTAGLNAGSPERAADNFLAFAIVLIWSALISLWSYWKPIVPPPQPEAKLSETTEQGLRMGIGASLALAISYALDFAKLGWAPSAVGNVVRYETHTSRKRAWARFYGTIGGAFLAFIALALLTTIEGLVLVGAIGAILNGLFKKTILGAMPLFYTATILLLYSSGSIGEDTTVVLERVVYNLVGITIGIVVVMYPFSWLFNKIPITRKS